MLIEIQIERWSLDENAVLFSIYSFDREGNKIPIDFPTERQGAVPFGGRFWIDTSNPGRTGMGQVKTQFNQ